MGGHEIFLYYTPIVLTCKSEDVQSFPGVGIPKFFRMHRMPPARGGRAMRGQPGSAPRHQTVFAVPFRYDRAEEGTVLF